jgi:hypothetical protein
LIVASRPLLDLASLLGAIVPSRGSGFFAAVALGAVPSRGSGV